MNYFLICSIPLWVNICWSSVIWRKVSASRSFSAGIRSASAAGVSGACSRHCLILVAAIGISLHWVAAIAGCTGRCRTTIRLAVLVCTRMSGIAVRTVGWYKVPVLDIDPRTGICLPRILSFLINERMKLQITIDHQPGSFLYACFC